MDRNYIYFAIWRRTGKIVNGWDSTDNYYAKYDIKDKFPQFKLKEFKFLTRKSVLKLGLEPENYDYWTNPYNPKFKDLVRNMTGKQIMQSMIDGLKNPKTTIDMGTYGA